MNTQLDLVRQFHAGNKNWAGKGTLQYVPTIESAFKKHHCQTLLDYGCGKGHQYSVYQIHNNLGIPLSAVYQFDPGYEPVSQEPDWNSFFDCSICLDVLQFCTDQQIDDIKQKLQKVTAKVCIIGIGMAPPKNLKKPYASLHPADWWQQKFSNWSGPSELVLELQHNTLSS
jgi:hypothetical protein